jgi:hypothetical protein
MHSMSCPKRRSEMTLSISASLVDVLASRATAYAARKASLRPA